MTHAKKNARLSMAELLAMTPDTGISQGEESNSEVEFVATHPEEWSEVFLSSRGRPRKGQETGSEGKTVRFPSPFWAHFRSVAKIKKLSIHQAMRAALIEWVAKCSAATETPRRRKEDAVIATDQAGAYVTASSSARGVSSGYLPFEKPKPGHPVPFNKIANFNRPQTTASIK